MPGTIIKLQCERSELFSEFDFFLFSLLLMISLVKLFSQKKSFKKSKLKWRCSRHELAKGVIREHTIVIQFPLCSFNSPDAKKMPRAVRGSGPAAAAIRSKMEQLVILVQLQLFLGATHK